MRCGHPSSEHAATVLAVAATMAGATANRITAVADLMVEGEAAEAAVREGERGGHFGVWTASAAGVNAAWR